MTPLEMPLNAIGARIYVTATDGTTAQVGYFEAGTWQEVLQDKPPILGPQTSQGGTLWIAVAGVLGRLQPEGVVPAAESRMITCLEQWNEQRHVCLGGAPQAAAVPQMAADAPPQHPLDRALAASRGWGS